jgi:hypothetical protein
MKAHRVSQEKLLNQPRSLTNATKTGPSWKIPVAGYSMPLEWVVIKYARLGNNNSDAVRQMASAF